MAKAYNHREIEEKWSRRWEKSGLYRTDVSDTKNKFYCLDMFPYPSGEGLHVGHWRGYVMSDFYARHALLQGKNLFHPMGFDAFGLPAENAAIKSGSHPKKFTDRAIVNFTRQLKQVAAAYDWSKTINTSDPGYYKWTQWLFLQLFKHGLAEKRKSLVNWCPKDQTVLANEQVVDGCCERCGSQVTKKELEQWYFLTTKLAEELNDGLEDVEWPEHVKTLQRNWIGRSDGAEVEFKIQNSNFNITVFTTRPDTLFGVTAIVLAPEHPLTAKLAAQSGKTKEFERYFKEVSAKTNVDRSQGKESQKTAINLGVEASHPITGENIPVWAADYVLMEYGTGAVMSVPGHDERDFMFAKTHDLPIKQVIAERLTQSFEPGMYRPELPTVSQDGVIVFVKHWEQDKYIGLKWKSVDWGTLLTGSVDEGETPEKTALKEIREETGYVNAKITKKYGVVDGLFFHVPKNVNKLVHGHVFLVELGNGEQQKVASDEESKHEVCWLTAKELETFLTADTHKYALRWLASGYLPALGSGTLINSGKYSGEQSAEAADRIVADLESAGAGQFKTTFRLRDWLVSRQRYWGAPIPIVYDPAGKAYPVKEEHLPLELPTDVDFQPGGVSPLARSQNYKERAEKLYGKGWRFETDTLDTFVDSSWYYLRYPSPDDPSQPFDKKLVSKWLPVDLYIGGIEHATLHLLYARFIYRFLVRYNYVKSASAEPFRKLFNIGMINLHGQKMSKSKGNVVSPDPLIEHYGTDALRGYELFVGPLDVEAEWNPRGINGVHKFLIKVNGFARQLSDQDDNDVPQLFNGYLSALNGMITGYRLNTVISEQMKLFNNLSNKAVSAETFGKIVITLAPTFPYLAEELWERLGHNESVFRQKWPKITRKLSAKKINILVNQKFIAAIPDPGSQSAAKQAVATLAEVKKRVADRKYRVVYKKDKVINLIVS